MWLVALLIILVEWIVIKLNSTKTSKLKSSSRKRRFGRVGKDLYSANNKAWRRNWWIEYVYWAVKSVNTYLYLILLPFPVAGQSQSVQTSLFLFLSCVNCFTSSRCIILFSTASIQILLSLASVVRESLGYLFEFLLVTLVAEYWSIENAQMCKFAFSSVHTLLTK